ncbi:MAG: hypothetical protein L0H96_12690 [Humibacillus sp.]|nr:hypothetical protein [Humibacillus sp.]MDN5777762.1 hypothetical protein [Humibacillus sp.]
MADTIADGVVLRDKVEVEAARYDRPGAVVALKIKTRPDLHHLLNIAQTRSRAAWKVVDEHRQLAVGTVGGKCGPAAIVAAPRVRAPLHNHA